MRAAETLAVLLAFLLWPLLPEGWRRRWPWPLPASPSVLAHLSSYLSVVASVVAWYALFVLYAEGYGEKISALLVERDAAPGALTWYGLPVFFSFFFTVKGFLVTLWLGDSLARAVCAAASGEPLGSLFLWAPLCLVQRGVGALKEAERTRRYGSPAEPDRLRLEGETLFVSANRPHADWNPLLTFRYGGRFYRLRGFTEVPEGRRRAFLYRLTPWRENDPIRRVVDLGGPEQEPGPGAFTEPAGASPPGGGAPPPPPESP